MKKCSELPVLNFLWATMLAAAFGCGMAGFAEDIASSNAPVVTAAHSQKEKLSRTEKAGEWKDPEQTLDHIGYEGVPITDVGSDLKARFNDAFDVLIPASFRGDCPVTMQLKNVKASEIFNAMNLVFESGNTPLHWELTRNGSRPTALLRVLPQESAPAGLIDPTTGLPAKPATAPAQKSMVFFVGDLVGDPKSGRMSMAEVAKTVTEICRFGIGGEHISCYEPAQLLVVRGTEDEIQFAQSTLMALRDKALLDAQKAFAREHGESETSFWPEAWTKPRRNAEPEAGGNHAPAKTDATSHP